MQRTFCLSGIILMLVTSGCYYELRDEMNECSTKCANKWAARAAWRDAQGCYQGICCWHSFKEGFFAGYIAVADGGTGCLPAVPEIECCNHMWMDFRCSENDKMEAWYDGYEQGVIAAKAEGMADVNRITTRAPQPNGSISGPGQSSINSSPTPAIPPAPINPPPSIYAPAPIDSPTPADGPSAMRQQLDQYLK